MVRRLVPLLATLLVVSGCLHPVRQEIDATVCDLASCPRDVLLDVPQSMPSTKDGADDAVRPASHYIDPELPPPRKDDKGGPGKPETRVPLTIPPTLPGAEVGPIRLPPILLENEAERRKVLEKYYPDLGPLGPDPEPQPGPHGRPLSLEDLQREALAKNPLIAQAVANVIAARGAALEAGLPPNPNIGFEIDTFGTAGGAGYTGAFIEQVIRTGGKLQLARASAAMDLKNAEVALRRAQTDLMTRVRGFYFAVLVADEGVRVNRALVEFTEQIYRNQLLMLIKGGQVAAYEPMQLRQSVNQARVALLTARNSYTSAWKQLAAALGDPGMPPTQIVGAKDMPYPIYDYADVLARVLHHHTDVLTAENGVLRARYNLQLAQVTPYPDVDVRVLLQKDKTGPPFFLTPSVSVGVPIPIWDRNQGGILQAEGQLANATEEPHRVRAALTGTLAEAFGRYNTYREAVAVYRDSILPDGVRVYEALYKRYRIGLPNPTPDWPDFSAVVTIQQTLVQNVATYLSDLGLFWQAVVDVTDVLQTDNLFAYSRATELPPLPQLPCHHPCAPFQDPTFETMHGDWPQAVPPGPVEKPMPKVDESVKRSQKSSIEKAKPAVKQPEKVPAGALQPLPSRPEPINSDALLLEPPPVVGQTHTAPGR